jgi:photosystem II stability/assembly factor-like uncharacterized protein
VRLRTIPGLLLMVTLAALLTACVSVREQTRLADNGDDAQEETTATPRATIPPPTPVPSGSPLRLDGLAAKQVVLWDADLPAEFAATQYVLYRRSDSRTWRRVGELPIQGHLLADSADPNLLYLGDHPPCLTDGEPIPFYRSTDGGETWTEIENAQNIRPILVWPENRDVIIGSRCGLAISQNSGITWQRHLPESEFDLTRLNVTQIGLFGVFTSGNGVSHLRKIHIEDPNQPEFDEPILSFWGSGAIHASQDRILVGEVGGVHFSDDGGRTWSSTKQGLDDVVASVDPLEEEIPQAELESGLGIFALLPHPQNTSRIFLGTIRGLYLSEDNGQSWGKIPEVEDRRVTELAFSMGGSILYVTTDEGVIVLHNP